MHLEELDIHNFRGFKDYTLKLKPFNVLIGENNSGKTSVLQAIQLVYESMQVLFGGEEHPRFTALRYFMWVTGNPGAPIEDKSWS